MGLNAGRVDSVGSRRNVSRSAMKKFISLLAALAASLSMIAAPIQDIPIKDIDGKDTSLKAFNGKVVLVVNVASKCGYTPQYKGLEATHRKYKEQGFSVVGFPCNDFGKQEPGSASEIKEFCSLTYNVTFPLMEKVHVKGAEQHPIYAALTGKDSPFPGDVKWNFGKFLIGKDGQVLKRWDSGTEPTSEEVSKAIEAALKAK
jgi:glutathione peroxidase